MPTITSTVTTTPSNEGGYWVVSVKPLEDFTVTYEVTLSTTDAPVIRVQRPPRTDDWREQQYWDIQLHRETTFRETATQTNVFDNPQFWSNGYLDVFPLHREVNLFI